MADASAVIDIPASPEAPKKAKKPAQKANVDTKSTPAAEPSVETLQAQLTIVTRQRDTLLASLNMLKTAVDERIILTQAQLNEIGRQG